MLVTGPDCSRSFSFSWLGPAQNKWSKNSDGKNFAVHSEKPLAVVYQNLYCALLCYFQVVFFEFLFTLLQCQRQDFSVKSVSGNVRGKKSPFPSRAFQDVDSWLFYTVLFLDDQMILCEQGAHAHVQRALQQPNASPT